MAASRRPSKRRTSRRCSRRLATCRCCVDERRGEPAALLRVSAGSLSVTLAVKAVEPDGVAKASPESQSRPRPYGSCTLAADGVAEIPPYGPGAGRHHPGRYGVELRGPVLCRHRRRDEARQQEHVVARVQRFVRKPETTSSYRASRPSPHAPPRGRKKPRGRARGRFDSGVCPASVQGAPRSFVARPSSRRCRQRVHERERGRALREPIGAVGDMSYARAGRFAAAAAGRRKQASWLGPAVRRFPATTPIVGERAHSPRTWTTCATVASVGSTGGFAGPRPTGSVKRRICRQFVAARLGLRDPGVR
jgi:hypothetical protein